MSVPYFSMITVTMLIALAFCGCGPKYLTTNLEGKVTLDGIAASQGGITFTPLTANHGKGVFASVVDGHYEAREVAVGAARVTFRLTKRSGRTFEVYGKQVPEILEIVPPKYVRGLEIDVHAGEGTRDFELESK